MIPFICSSRHHEVWAMLTSFSCHSTQGDFHFSWINSVWNLNLPGGISLHCTLWSSLADWNTQCQLFSIEPSLRSFAVITRTTTVARITSRNELFCYNWCAAHSCGKIYSKRDYFWSFYVVWLLEDTYHLSNSEAERNITQYSVCTVLDSHTNPIFRKVGMFDDIHQKFTCISVQLIWIISSVRGAYERTCC